jgi:PIN domain
MGDPNPSTSSVGNRMSAFHARRRSQPLIKAAACRQWHDQDRVRAIYFDTSVLRTLPFRGIAGALGPIIKLRDELHVDLWTIDVCVREFVGHHVRSLREAITKLGSAFASTRMYHQTSSDLVKPVCMSEADINVHVVSELKSAQIGVLATAAIDINELMDMAIARRPPFDDQGGGFRDALILETFTKHAAENYQGDDVLLAAADKDFAATELHARGERLGIRISKVQSIEQIPSLVYGARLDAVSNWYEDIARVAVEMFEANR